MRRAVDDETTTPRRGHSDGVSASVESEVRRIDLSRTAVGDLCVLQRAHDHPPLIGSDVEHDFGMIWQEQIGAVTRR